VEVDKLAHLLVRLERGANETAAGFTGGMTMVAGLFGIFAVIFAMQHRWAISALMIGVAAFMVWLGRKAAARNTPETMLPVVATTHRLLVKANDDWEPLVTLLRERCPRATLIDR